MTAAPDAADPADSPTPGRPTISIVTPCFNHAPYLRATMESVLNQQGAGTEFELEYVVMDGGSTDGSAEIVREYADRLAHWRSAPDDGHYASVNEGFEHTSGGIMAWLNSDDMYCPWALRTVAQIFTQHPGVAWLTSAHPITWTKGGQCGWVGKGLSFSTESLREGLHLPGAIPQLGMLQQESTFWRRELWDALAAERAAEEPDAPPGALRPRFTVGGDHDLWQRFAAHTPPATAACPLGGFRQLPGQRSSMGDNLYVRECYQAVEEARAAAGLPPLPSRTRAKRPLRERLTYRLGRGPMVRRGHFRCSQYYIEDLGADRPRWLARTIVYP
ncbi:glycosyltransferase [Alienimonas sp. DA493]|uniref:glycosyltransferase n=1 Tax=Alienimonas sp. DA493 TaxID=3373605 RepID=UPI003754F6B1